MESIPLKKNSWHYRLATVYGKWSPYRDGDAYDICSYGRKVAFGALIALVFAIIGAVAVNCVVDAVMFFSMFNYYDESIIHVWGIFGTVGTALAVLSATCRLAVYLLRKSINWIGDWFRGQAFADTIYRAFAKCKPSFLGSWYRSYKDKVCFRVTFEE